jgi:hypothetical protein
MPIPTSRRRLVQAAVTMAITALQDERVRAQLRRTPQLVRRIDPTARFGQRGLERRLDALRRNLALAFPDRGAPGAVELARALDELDRALAITATMPLTGRVKAHARIGGELDRLESALVDAVLPR